MKQIIIVLFCIFTTSVAFSTTNTLAKKQRNMIQNYTKSIFHGAKHLTAVSVALQCKHQVPVYFSLGTNGFKDLTPINKNSLFPIGSVTKSFVSVVILQILQEQHLSIDTPIAAYFPEYSKWGKITIRQLLNMTSGIPGNSTVKEDDIFRKFTAHEYHNYISPVKILNLTYRLPLDFKPGARYEYSNANYTLLGLLIEKLAHHNGIAEINKRIIDKLGLLHTYFVKDKLAKIPGINKREIVHGYDFYRKGSNPYSFEMYGQNTTNFSLSYANYSGAIVSTAADINHFIHALYTPGVLLSASQVKQLTSLISKATGQPYIPQKEPGQIGYGLGIFGFYSQQAKQIVYFYQGQVNGYQSYYFYLPVTHMFLTLLLNTTSRVVNYKNTTKFLYKLKETCR